MISRRSFVSGCAAAGLSGSVAGCRPDSAPEGCVRYSSDVPVYGVYDVAVFGAGPGGIAAAIAAARAGKRTILVEKYGTPGGVSTWGATPLFFRFGDSDSKPTRQLVGGIADEIVRELDRRGETSLFRDCNCYEPSNERIGGRPLLSKVMAPQEPLRLVYYDFLDKAGVEKLFMAHLAGVVREGRRMTAAIVDCLEGPRAIRAKVFVDATGDAHLVHRAGAATVLPAPDETMHKSIFFEVCGVKPHDVAANWKRHGELKKKGMLPDMVWAFPGYTHYPEQDHYLIPIAYAVGDNCSSKDMTRMDAELRRRNWALLDFYRQNFDGYADAYWVNSAWQVGARDGRHIVARKTFDRSIVKGDKLPEDGVVPTIRLWGLNHSTRQKEGFSAKVDSGWRKGITQIPYGSLVPRDLDNVLAAGRCIGEETYVIGCTRMMPTCFATGQVAGTAAALALDRSLADVGAVPHAELCKRLESQGHIVA